MKAGKWKGILKLLTYNVFHTHDVTVTIWLTLIKQHHQNYLVRYVFFNKGCWLKGIFREHIRTLKFNEI